MTESNPVPIHGNYYGYYNKRPSITDSRLALLPPEIFSGKTVLDIGCNEGWVTCEIAQSWDARKVIGVDIDDGLIRAAWKRRRTVWSLQVPTQELDSERPTKRPRRTSTIANYFPASFEHSFGPLSIPPATPNTANKFPHNIAFFTSDWVHNPIPTDKDSYDVVLAFSISKWIHLNGGDDAIITFFNRVFMVLNHGGVFVLEPQAWETYGKARKMDEKLRTNAKTLKLRPKDFEAKLQEIGFGPAKHLGVAGQGGFRRPVDIYIKP